MYCRCCCTKLGINFENQTVDESDNVFCSYCGKKLSDKINNSPEFMLLQDMSIIKNKLRVKWQNYKIESNRLAKEYYRYVKTIKDESISTAKKKELLDRIIEQEF